MGNYFPYCNFDKLRISQANGLRFRYLTEEGSFFDGESIPDNKFYNDDSKCGFNWEPYSQTVPCDGTIRFQFQWCDANKPFVHLFKNGEFIYELVPEKVFSGSFDIYEREINFSSESGFCNSCLYVRIGTYDDGEIIYHAQSEPIFMNDIECLVKIEYWNDDDYDGQYFCNGFRNIIYVQAQFTKFAPQETTKVYITSNNDQRVLSKNIAKKRTLDINYLPEYVHDILIIALSMDNTELDGESYTANAEYTITDNPALYSLNKASVELYKNLYKFENSNCDNDCGGNLPVSPTCTLPEDDFNVFGGDASSFL